MPASSHSSSMVIQPPVFYAAQYARAYALRDAQAEQKLAQPLVEAIQGGCFPVIDDEEKIIYVSEKAKLRNFQLLLSRLPSEALRQYPGDQRRYGFLDRGEESYIVDGNQKPEGWKSSLYLSKVWKGGCLQLPLEHLPQNGDLEPLSPEEREFFQDFLQRDYLWIDQHYHRLATAVLNAVGQYVLGLERGHFDHPFFQGDETFPGFGVGRLLSYFRDRGERLRETYISSEPAQVGDIIAGPHEDTFPTALVATLWGGTKLSSLEIQLPDGSFAAMETGGSQRHSWNYGWSLFIYALAKHHVPPQTITEIIATRDISLAPAELRSRIGFPTTHRVVRRHNPDNPLPAAIPEESLERLAYAHFSGFAPRTWMGVGTFQQVTSNDFNRYLRGKAASLG